MFGGLLAQPLKAVGLKGDAGMISSIEDPLRLQRQMPMAKSPWTAMAMEQEQAQKAAMDRAGLMQQVAGSAQNPYAGVFNVYGGMR